jgi:hypothetical protein
MNDAPEDHGDNREFGDWWRAMGEHELRQLLFWVWDPIEIKDEFPTTAGEYDGYALEIATALASGMSSEELAALLQTIEQDRMGISRARADATASRLSDWYERSRRTFASAMAAR